MCQAFCNYRIKHRIHAIYNTLQSQIALNDPSEWGPCGQWPIFGRDAGIDGYDERWEIMVGCVLVRGGWQRGRKALENLIVHHILSVRGIDQCPAERLTDIIQPAAFKIQKTVILKQLASLLAENWNGDLDAFLAQDTKQLRKELLRVKGIGDETADTILLYAASRPVFIIDAFTRRMVRKAELGTGKETYAQLQKRFHAAYEEYSEEERVRLFQHFHALIDEAGF